MKKLMCSLLVFGTLAAAPQAVVFDWGNVIATEDRSVVVDFMCQTFQFSESEFERVNLEKRKAVKSGKSESVVTGNEGAIASRIYRCGNFIRILQGRRP